MTNVLSPALATILYVGGRIGPDGVVTGWVLINAILVAATTYAFCVGVDWAVAKVRQS